jgi:hypothetical protein
VYINKPNMLNKHLYVRVKRSREDDPVENLCLVEDAAPPKKRSMKALDAQLSGLSASSVPVPPPRRLLLSRVRTLQHADDSLLSGVAVHGTEETDEELPRKRRAVAKIVVTSGSKTVLTGSSEQCMVIDMAQVVSKPLPPAPALVSAVGTAAVSRILDPATRLLDRGIQTAVKNGDFNDVSSALMQGANADHQTASSATGSQGGYTALMAACLHCNIRMVKRLVMKGVDVAKVSTDGRNALDLLTVTPRNTNDANEIRTLLHALVKAAQSRAAPCEARHPGSSIDADYVYDIYQVDSTAQNAVTDQASADIPTATSAAEVDAIMTGDNDNDAECQGGEPMSVVRVEGLRILDADHIELMMAYDSDWSDLGDDEDPDSNDERFHGNDYPEDEENEGYELQDSDEDAHIPRGGAQRGTRARLAVPKGAKVGNFLQPVAGAAAPVSRAGRAKRSSEGDNRVHFNTDGAVDGELDLQDLIWQEEAAALEGEGSVGSSEEEEAALYRELDGDYHHEADDDAMNSDYDFEADEEAGRGEGCGETDDGTMQCEGRDCNPRPERPQRRNRPGKPRPARDSALSSTEHLLCDDDANLPDFERRFGIGKVLRPQILMDSHASEENMFSQRGLYQDLHTTETLQELWGETDGNREDYSAADTANGSASGAGTAAREHGDRLEHMRNRTGMVFAASAREFDPHSGLAKYGMELSDDEDVDRPDVGAGAAQGYGYDRVVHTVEGKERSYLQYRDERPPLDTVAYDSELDASD